MRTARMGTAVGRMARSAAGPVWSALTAPPIARGGATIATAGARLWGRILGGEEHRVGELIVISDLPSWAFGRGGTTVGRVFLTRSALHPEVLAHEDVHRRQWERYGLFFIPLYFAAGLDALTNRFEIEAGLVSGGYLPKPSRGPAGDRAPRR